MIDWTFKIVFTFFFILLFQVGQAQTKADIIQQRLEFISEQFESEEISMEDVFDVLSYHYDHPLNLNDCSKEELEQLMLLNNIQINDLLTHIEDGNEFKTIYELLNLNYWNSQLVEMILPFIRIGIQQDSKVNSFRDKLSNIQSEVISRWIRVAENKAGYESVSDEQKLESNSYYWGSPDKLYTRYRLKYEKKLSIGLTMEKDPGEQLIRNDKQFGYDFYSAHAYYKGNKWLRKIALGDYHFEMGQGLAFWSGYAFGKTADAMLVKKNARGISPFTSVDESRFLRGAAAEFGFRNWSVSFFASQKKIDGSLDVFLDSTINEEVRFASSINLTGLHRTTSERAKMNSIQEQIYGTYLKYESRSLHLGIGAVQQQYDTPLDRPFQEYSQFEFNGSQLLNLNFDYNYVYRNLNFFGEIANSTDSKSFAILQGLTMAIDNKAEISLIYRKYDKQYHTFYASGFGERSRTINEEGIFMGTKFSFNNAWNMNTYVDLFKFPWLTYGVNLPSFGNEILGQLTYKPSNKIELYVRVREKNKMQNSSNYNGVIRPIENNKQRNYRINFTYQLSKEWQWKNRIELVTVNRTGETRETGLVISQDLIYRPKKIPIDLIARYALFDTENFDTRLYVYESNLLNVFSVPAYFNEGSRYYLMIKYQYKQNFEFWIRYASFIYANQLEIGSGAELIEGTTKSEVGVQLRIRF